jgi:flavin reductase (DIM6/NTAB) family NADH-FMN oxidoreductase RutF
VYVSQANHTHRLVAVAPHVGVHLVPADGHELGRLFGEETGDEVDKFEHCRWEAGPFGVPMLLDVEDRFVGAVVGRAPGGDHDGFLLDPVAAWSAADPAAEPLRLHDVADLDPGHPA